MRFGRNSVSPMAASPVFREERKVLELVCGGAEEGAKALAPVVVLVAHEGEKAACYSLVYDEVEAVPRAIIQHPARRLTRSRLWMDVPLK